MGTNFLRGDWPSLLASARALPLQGLVSLAVDKYPRTTYEYGNHVHIYMRVNSYSTVGVIEQKDMVNSGVRGRKKMDLRPEVYSKVS